MMLLLKFIMEFFLDLSSLLVVCWQFGAYIEFVDELLQPFISSDLFPVLVSSDYYFTKNTLVKAHCAAIHLQLD